MRPKGGERGKRGEGNSRTRNQLAGQPQALHPSLLDAKIDQLYYVQIHGAAI